ncbi:MAG: hypothetical protein KDD43_08730, partial [Bdellovibrionales bacterium]|nr:hypothetical protein [Bdellovibrionales bacterium]
MKYPGLVLNLALLLILWGLMPTSLLGRGKDAAGPEPLAEVAVEYSSSQRKIPVSRTQFSLAKSEEALFDAQLPGGTQIEVKSYDLLYARAVDGKLGQAAVGVSGTHTWDYSQALNDILTEHGIEETATPGSVIINGNVELKASLSASLIGKIEKEGSVVLLRSPLAKNSGFYVSYGLEQREAELVVAVKSVKVSCDELSASLSLTHVTEDGADTTSRGGTYNCGGATSSAINRKLLAEVSEENTRLVTVETYAILGVGYRSPEGSHFEVVVKPDLERSYDIRQVPSDFYGTEEGSDIPFSISGEFRRPGFSIGGGIEADTFNGNWCSISAHASASGQVGRFSLGLEKMVSADLTAIRDETRIPIGITIGKDQLTITPGVTRVGVSALKLSEKDDCATDVGGSGYVQSSSATCYRFTPADQDFKEGQEYRSLAIDYSRPNKWSGGFTYTEDQGLTKIESHKDFGRSSSVFLSLVREHG